MSERSVTLEMVSGDEDIDTSTTWRVLIIDSSEVAITVLSEVFARSDDFEVVGTAQSSVEGLAAAISCAPDLVVIDPEHAPSLGYRTVEKLAERRSLAVLVVATHDRAELAYRCLGLGALEVLAKPDRASLDDDQFVRHFLNQARLLAATTGVRQPIKGPAAVRTTCQRAVAGTEDLADALVVIAASTGGPKALSRLLGQLPGSVPAAFVVVQHLVEGFEEGLINWLAQSSDLTVLVAADGSPIKQGHVYVVPPGHHVCVSEDRTLCFVESTPVAGHRPSAKFLFESGAAVFGPRCTGVILTGMGDDGAEALSHIKLAGGLTIAQDETSSAVFGMPRAAIELGTVREVLALEDIAPRLVDWLGA